MTPNRIAAPLLLALPLALSLAGCISFGPKPPPSTIRLQAAEMAPAGTGGPLVPARTVTVLMPTAPQDISVLRVPVRSGNAALAYLDKAQYADNPLRLFRDLVAETIRARTGRPVFDGRDYHIAPGARLNMRVERFSVDADTRQVDMIVDTVLQQPGATGAATRRFEGHAPVAAVTAAAVSPVLGQVANDVARQVADWVGR